MAVGVLMGLSVLQNGKIPQFIQEDVIAQYCSRSGIITMYSKSPERFKQSGYFSADCEPTSISLFVQTISCKWSQCQEADAFVNFCLIRKDQIPAGTRGMFTMHF